MAQNDPAFVELSLERLGDNFDLEEFVYAIRANKTVRHVCFSETFVRELQEDQWHVMLENIGYLETLEELQIWCSTIPCDIFARAIRRATNLQKVYFFRVALAGDQAAVNELAEALREHPSLRDVRIGGFHLTEVDNDLDAIVEALAVAPNLEVVSLQLSGCHQEVPFKGEALEKLFKSKTVTDLYLSRLGLGEEHIQVIASALEGNNSTMRVLDLFGNNIEDDQITMIAEALITNTSLETLVLPCPTEMTGTSCAAISKALKANKTLATLNLPRSNFNDEGVLLLAEGLTVNTTLKKIEVGVSKKLSEEGMQALTDMLEKNYELERLVVSSADRSVKDKVEYFMRLNEVGRGSLLRDGKATRETWVEMLSSVSNDLDCLFYLTTKNPTLVQLVNPTNADVIITQELPINRRHTMGHYSTDRAAAEKKKENRRASAF